MSHPIYIWAHICSLKFAQSSSNLYLINLITCFLCLLCISYNPFVFFVNVLRPLWKKMSYNFGAMSSWMKKPFATNTPNSPTDLTFRKPPYHINSIVKSNTFLISCMSSSIVDLLMDLLMDEIHMVLGCSQLIYRWIGKYLHRNIPPSNPWIWIGLDLDLALLIHNLYQLLIQIPPKRRDVYLMALCTQNVMRPLGSWARGLVGCWKCQFLIIFTLFRECMDWMVGCSY
jgi:hypothetical protein